MKVLHGLHKKVLKTLCKVVQEIIAGGAWPYGFEFRVIGSYNGCRGVIGITISPKPRTVNSMVPHHDILNSLLQSKLRTHGRLHISRFRVHSLWTSSSLPETLNQRRILKGSWDLVSL